MKLAVIYDDGQIFVEIDPERFRGLLATYTAKLGSTDAALDQIIRELKDLTRKR